jgi:6-pyruvoyltetrahydropterin/6-carboxytetrahydropterin synthase
VGVLEITRRMEFSASHRLWRSDWKAARNREVFGEDADRVEYGHNYALEVTLEGPVDPETGMLLDLKELKEIMEREVAARFDHRHLNEDTDYFADRPPTAENFAETLFDLLDAALPGDLLKRVRLCPRSDLCVEVSR